MKKWGEFSNITVVEEFGTIHHIFQPSISPSWRLSKGNTGQEYTFVI